MRIHIYNVAVALAFALALAACKATKQAQQPAGKATAALSRQDFMQKVAANVHNTQFVTSKVKVRLQVGDKDFAISGSLKMKRDDVIRLQLVAFGIMEAGRMEFTPDYAMVVDRINKQYIKVAYSEAEMLQQAGINFHTLQGLFWNELFTPGAAGLTAAALDAYNVDLDGPDAIITLNRGPLTYSWTADKQSGAIKRATVTHADEKRGDTLLTWDYADMKPMGAKLFPAENTLTVATPKRKITLSFTLGDIDSDDDWETRTEISSRYTQVKVSDIMEKLAGGIQ